MSKVSIIGVGMITTPGMITYRMFQALAWKKNQYYGYFYIRN